MSRVVIHTDGSCLKNPGGIGGWAAILELEGQAGGPQKAISGAVPAPSTNNRMEIQAVIEGLRALKKAPVHVEIVSDSQYVIHGFTEGWVVNWRAKNWQRWKGQGHRSLEPVPNADLWEQLDDLVRKHHVTWTHIRGHQGNVLNERCDELAYAAAIKLKESLSAA